MPKQVSHVVAKMIIQKVYNFEELDDLFVGNDEGQNQVPTATARNIAADLLEVPADKITWHLPDVFAVRYGSCYVATATAGSKSVRFLSEEGDFKEGDDR